MGRLHEGVWYTTEQWEADQKGHFRRQVSAFRETIQDDPQARFRPAAGRYHLYVSHACPWAHRVMMVRALMGLEEAIDVSVVHPFMGEDGWIFSHKGEDYPDSLHGLQYLRDLYTKADPHFSGRVTVPVLWDKQEQTIVNNESREIIRMLGTSFQAFAKKKIDLAPIEHLEAIEQTMDAIYEPINNGVYRCGFAHNQEAYEDSFDQLFAALDRWEDVLSKQRFLVGETFTEADICLFTTLYRFDAVYYVHFKCNNKRIVDYPNLWAYTREIYQLPAIRETCVMDHIKRHYYQSHPHLNPTRFVPKGPALDFEAPHDRARLPGQIETLL
ncbi:MAG: glutathione S-transferase family protein [Myxococcales bacterium]|nr:glutathione S-transferase family protein [Myxococcales bacterium]